MPIDRQKLNASLLDLRVTMLEFMVARLAVVIRASGSNVGPKSALPRAQSEVLSEFEVIAQTLETSAFVDQSYGFLLPEERALLSDEFRETMERMKSRIALLFSAMNL